MKRNYDGIWIPRDLWEDRRLTLIERCLYREILSLHNVDGCYATNKHFADFLGVSLRGGVDVLRRLSQKGWIRAEGKGRARKLIPLVNYADIAQYNKEDSSANKEDTSKPSTLEQNRKEHRTTPKADTAGFLNMWRSHAGEQAILAPRDYTLVKKLLGDYSIEQMDPWVALYHKEEWWWVNGQGKSFGPFYTHLGEVIAMVQEKAPKAQKDVCPECGVSEGRHRESCTRAKTVESV